MPSTHEFKNLTDRELFDKMLSHHVMRTDKNRTERSRWHHQNLYEHMKHLLWDRLSKNNG